MKLKRKWPSVCIWVVFIIFDVIMVASSGFFSGLFPSKDIVAYTFGVTIVGVLLMGIVTYLLGKVCDATYIDDIAKTTFCKLIYVLMIITTLVGGVIVRADALGRTVAEPAGKLSLYENAMVGAPASSEYDLLSLVYSKILNVVLLFTGNRIIFAYYFQIALFILFALLGAIICRLLMGKAASLVFTLYVCFMPLFMDNFSSATISTDELFILMYGLELLFLAIYLRLDSDGKFTSGAYVILYIILGAVIGFMTYVDAGTAVVVLPLVLSGLFLHKSEPVKEVIRLSIIIVSALAAFWGMILQEGGFDRFDVVLSGWSKYFFKNINTFSTFWTYTNYKTEYLVTFIVMSGVIVGYWKNKYFERVSPWLLSTMLVFFATPFFGATRMNSQMMLTIYFAFVLGCVASLITLDANVMVETERQPINEAVSVPINSLPSEPLVVMPEEPAAKLRPEMESDEAPYESEAMQEDKIDEVSEEVSEDKLEDSKAEDIEAESSLDDADENPVEVIEEQHAEIVNNDSIKETGNAFESYTTRFVPEGMVLPEGAEDEMDITKSKMKMPKFKGTIALDRNPKDDKKDKAPVKETPKKDDFDIEFTPGDDFDF
ncbi:MAG: hypothetical protein II842_17435 [Butyrivibrio sp.]|nr:hypothetical protein [Butyrivibrio sp.]